MAALDLTKYGITGTKSISYNPSYEQLFKDEMDPSLTGYDKGQLTELDAVNVMTGIYTGRSPKDKYIVMDEFSKDTVWWTTPEYPNDNHVATKEVWETCKKLAIDQLSDKDLYVVDAFCGANEDTRMAVRFIMEVAWQAHFVENMFIKPTAEELEHFEPNFVVYTASKALSCVVVIVESVQIKIALCQIEPDNIEVLISVRRTRRCADGRQCDAVVQLLFRAAGFARKSGQSVRG